MTIGVKVCGLTDPLNAQEIVDTGADFIGYIFYRGSKRFVGDNPSEKLFSNIPRKVRKVGVFVNEDTDKVVATLKKFDIHTVQLHGDETPEYCKAVRKQGFEVIKAFRLHRDFDFRILLAYMGYCDYFMFDTKTGEYGGSGVKFDWELLLDYNLEIPFFLSGGIGPEDLAKIREFKHKAFYAADINSRFESAPGIKDKNVVRSFILKIKSHET